MDDGKSLDTQGIRESVTEQLLSAKPGRAVLSALRMLLDRDGIDPKRIGSFGQRPNDEDTDAQTVFPDIIARIRGSHRRNYLAIEVKKGTSRKGSDVDFQKLEAYKRELNYLFALFVEFRTGHLPGVADITWVGDP